MNKTYQSGDRVLILKNFYTIETNDILIFNRDGEDLIKRCVGMPGNNIIIRDGIIYLNSIKSIQSTTLLINNNKKYDIFVKSDIYNTYKKSWTPLNFGNYKIPKEGMKIDLNMNNLNTYENIILTENKDSIPSVKSSQNTYIFDNNYYFMVVDNRSGSVDSRSFGPIVSSEIKGKVIFNFNSIL